MVIKHGSVVALQEECCCFVCSNFCMVGLSSLEGIAYS